MGDKTEQPGPSEIKQSVIEPLDGDDVEGHRQNMSKLTDEPGPSEVRKLGIQSDEDDVEGHQAKKNL